MPGLRSVQSESSGFLLVCLLGGLFEGGQRLVPEPVEVGAKLGNPIRVEPVDPAIAVRTVGHKPGVLQHTKVLRDGGSADRQFAGKIAHGPGPVGEALEDLSPRRVGKRRESF